MTLLVDKIIRPILTEKSLAQAKSGRYTFEVRIDANKNQIREALNSSLGVKVKNIKTSILKEETRIITKSRRQVTGRKWKKATVELTEGKITMFEIGEVEDKKNAKE